MIAPLAKLSESPWIFMMYTYELLAYNLGELQVFLRAKQIRWPRSTMSAESEAECLVYRLSEVLESKAL